MATKVTWTDRPAGVDAEYAPVPNGYVWTKKDDYSITMPDSHADALKATPIGKQFSYQLIDPAKEAANHAALDAFAALIPGKEDAPADVTATDNPTTRLGDAPVEEAHNG